ncbi:hypothetical protein [Oricola indica]|uniref:hypothetical protein n=1 Tax=Oricola indica TaxID=2872591 RepID=UPI003CCB9072
MAKQGGARPGAGRKKGSPNVKSAEVIASAMEAGITPVEYMLGIMRDETKDAKDRAWAAEKAAPFVHPRPAPVPRTVEIDLPDIATTEGIKQAIAQIAAEVAAGNLAPTEAQSLVAIINAQKDAITTGEILERLERLEQQKGLSKWPRSAA